MCDIWSTYPRLKRSTAGVLEVLMQACLRRIFQNLSTDHVKALSVSLKLSSFQVRSTAVLPTRRKMEELKISDMKVVPCVDSRFIQPARVIFKQVSVTHWTWSYQSLTGVDQGFGCLDRWMGVSQTVYTPDARSPDWKYKSFCITLYHCIGNSTNVTRSICHRNQSSGDLGAFVVVWPGSRKFDTVKFRLCNTCSYKLWASATS